MTVANRAALRFAAGAGAVLGPHQAVLATLHRAGVSPWPGYDWRPTAPLGVPAVASAVFWGGLWGVAVVALLDRRNGAPATPPRYWAEAFAAGAILPTAVGAALAAAGHPASAAGDRPGRALLVALVANGLWGLGTAALAAPARQATASPASA